MGTQAPAETLCRVPPASDFLGKGLVTDELASREKGIARRKQHLQKMTVRQSSTEQVIKMSKS